MKTSDFGFRHLSLCWESPELRSYEVVPLVKKLSCPSVLTSFAAMSTMLGVRDLDHFLMTNQEQSPIPIKPSCVKRKFIPSYLINILSYRNCARRAIDRVPLGIL